MRNGNSGFGRVPPLRSGPGRAARAVGNDTTVANGAEPPALTSGRAFPPGSCIRAVFSALRARIPHATAEQPRASKRFRPASNCVRQGPSPGPSPLVPRGEGRIRSRIRTVCSPWHFPGTHSGRSVRVTSLPRCLRGRGRERGPPADAVRCSSPNSDPSTAPTSPRLWGGFGGVGGWCEPGGACPSPHPIRSVVEFSLPHTSVRLEVE
jgi:hypothetical protein